MTNKIAYIVSRFPHLPETFILREMIELEKLGWQVELYPLVLQRQPVIHEEAQPWIRRAHAVPWFSLGLLRANFSKFIQRPRHYTLLFLRVLLENIRSVKFLVRALLLFPRAVWMAEQFKAQGIRHIHAHYATHTALVAWMINQLTGIPYSITVHAHDIFVEKPMLATKIHDSVFVSSISEFNRNYLSQMFGPWVNEKTEIVRCGIEPSYYRAADPNGNESPRRLEIISVGSLQPYKGHIFLVQACEKLMQRGIPFRCRIVGGGDLRGALERAIDEYGLHRHLQLLGPRTQEEVSQFLSTANCYVQPSVVTSTGKMEGIPVALMEAMATRIPVVATAISGVPELVRPGETGWLVPSENVDALADALTDIYQNPAEATHRATLGQRWVLEEFELSTNVRKLASLFDRSPLMNYGVREPGSQSATATLANSEGQTLHR
jgi:glycosyltransferase involved in cell wall biosynthesis